MMHNDNYYFDVVRTNIKKERVKRGLTQQELADMTGITMNYIAKIESITLQRGFSISIVGWVADALGIDIRELFKPIEWHKKRTSLE